MRISRSIQPRRFGTPSRTSALAERLERRLCLAADPVISEFMAQNASILADKDGEYSDWIEIHNRGDEAASMLGWRLTDSDDELGKWEFPDVTIPAGGYRLVFASNKDLTTGNELHTNFKLDAGGEYLALVRPDETIASEFDEYPNQTSNISYGLSPEDGQTLQYFTLPTPGAANQLIASSVVFSQTSRTFSGSMVLQLSLPADAAPGSQIRFTTNRAAPTSTSAVYTTPLTLTTNTVIRAAVYESGVAPGPTTTHTYVSVDASVVGFNSNLPVLVLDTFGGGLNSTSLTPVSAYVIDTAESDGRARMVDLPDFAGRGGLRYRGQSSEGFPKKQFTFETWDEGTKDKAVSILGMPAESDWVIYAPYSEKSLMQNYLTYQWSNRIGQYAVRTRYVEVFLNTDGGTSISYASDYVGIYIFMEKIKIDDDRVDVSKLTPQDNTSPEVTGGYIFKNDKNDGNEVGFTTSRGYTFLYSDPGEEQLTAQQKAYLTSYMNEFESVLYGATYTDPVNGYAKYIDVDSWIDFHILTELAKNIDGFRISTYFTKDRDGKVKMGPLWDFNLSMGNANYNNGQYPTGWYYSILNDSNYRYFRRLFEDPDFAQKYTDRWQELRKEKLSTPQIYSDIDALVTLLSDGTGNYPVGSSPTQDSNNALVRNFKRWPILGTYVWPNATYPAAWIDEITNLKSFLSQRASWIDSLYPVAPTVTRGNSAPGQPIPVTLSVSTGNPIYYTLDGTDPRLPGGALSPAAQLYTGGFSVTSSTRVTARVRVGSAWSGPAELIIGIDAGIRVTEINYHPDPPAPGSTYNDDDYEFIELLNTGAQAVNLSGFRFGNGIDYAVEGIDVYGPETLQQWLSGGGGTAYAASRLGAAPPAALTPSGDALRLISDISTNVANRIAFDRTNTLATTDNMSLEFDLNASETASGGFAGATTVQGFDGVAGQTTYAGYRVAGAPAPDPTVVAGGPTGNFLRLITDGNNNQSNRVRFDRTLSGSYSRIIADFDFRISSIDTPADGFSLLFLPTSVYGATGIATQSTGFAAEEPNIAGVFAVGFDVYQANDVSLHWNGSQVHSYTLPTDNFSLAQGGFHHVRVELTHVTGGAQVSITLTRDAFSGSPQSFTIFSGVTINGLNAYDSRVEFAARSGGANMSVDLDNVDVRYLTGANSPVGVSALLLPVATFGTTGTGTTLSHFNSKPNVTGVFALDLAFDPLTGGQELSLHYGTTLLTVPFSRSVLDLASGQTAHVRLDLSKIGVSGVSASVTLTSATGTSVKLASNVLVSGLTLGQSRVEIAGRSTATAARIDVDNVHALWSGVEARILQPGSRAVIAKNLAAFTERYGTAGGAMIVGGYSGNFDNNGEHVILLDNAGAVAVDFTYDDSADWPGRADGDGSSLEVIDPFGDLSSPLNWRSSSEYRGSPGYAGVGPLSGVIINEVLANTDLPLLDAIELYNASASPIDISGWYLSDSSDNYAKFRIPDGVILLPGQYVVFDEGDFNPTPSTPGANDFALDGTHGDDVWLLKADPMTGALLAFADSVHFSSALSGESLGRWPNGSPTALLEPMTSTTLGTANSGVRFGPVIISEVMYNPADDVADREFVELRNTSASSVDIGAWQLDGAVNFDIPAGTVLAPGAFVVIVPFDPTAPADAARLADFLVTYPLAKTGMLIGPYTGKLDNAGDRIRLERPDASPPTDPTYTPYVLVDQLEYGVAAPWPVAVAGTSIARVDAAAYATNSANWTLATPSPGMTLEEPVFFGTAAADHYTFRLDGAGNLLEVFPGSAATGSPVYSQPLADVRSLTVIGLGGDDTVTADFTYGSPIPAFAGLYFDGGDDSDTLYVNTLGAAAPPGSPQRLLRFDAGGGANSLFIRGGNYALQAASTGLVNATVQDSSSIALVPGTTALGLLTLNTGARLALASGGMSALILNDIQTDGTGTIDLADNTLAVWGSTNPATALARIESLVRSARNAVGSMWTGPGITSSDAAAQPSRTLGTFVNDAGGGTPRIALLGGVPIPASWVIVKPTIDGDLDTDGAVDADDYFQIDSGFIAQSNTWARGDFNYDGRIDIDDYFIIDQGHARQTGPLAAGDSPAAAPAPGMIDLFGDVEIDPADLGSTATEVL